MATESLTPAQEEARLECVREKAGMGLGAGTSWGTSLGQAAGLPLQTEVSPSARLIVLT